MKTTDIYNALAALNQANQSLELAYIENEGEITPETEALEAQKAAVAQLLQEEGIDSLGRWLKAKKDEAEALKAEAYKVKRLREANARIQAHILELVGEVLRATDQERVKGTLYTFKQYTSDKVSANAQLLKDLYQEKALEAIHAAGIPECVTLTLGASSSLVPEGQALPEFFVRSISDTAQMVAPRKPKEE